MTFRGAVIKVEAANFCAAMDTLIDQDVIKVEVANFCAAMDTLIDQDGLIHKQPICKKNPPKTLDSCIQIQHKGHV